MMYIGTNRVDALAGMRQATLIKQAAAPSPGTMASSAARQPSMPDNSPNNLEVAKAVLKGGTESGNFNQLNSKNTSNTDPGAHVNSLSKLFRPASGNTQNVSSIASNQAKTQQGMVGGNLGAPLKPLPVPKIASVLRVSPGDLVKVSRASVRSLLSSAAGGAGRKLQALKDRLPALSQYREPALSPGTQLQAGSLGGVPHPKYKNLSIKPGTGQLEPLGFVARTRNLLSPKGLKQYLVGAGPKDKFTRAGRQTRTTVGSTSAETAPFGTYRTTNPKNPLEVMHGTAGQPLGMGFNDLSTWQKIRASRAANKQATDTGRRYSVAPWQAGRDVTKGQAGDKLRWGQRNQRTAGMGRLVPTRDSLVGKLGKSYLGFGAVGAGTTYYNPFYDMGLSGTPGDYQVTDVKRDPTASKLTLFERAQKGHAVGADWASYSTAPTLAASIANAPEGQLMGAGILNTLAGTEKLDSKLTAKQLKRGRAREYTANTLSGLGAAALGNEQAAQRAAKAEINRRATKRRDDRVAAGEASRDKASSKPNKDAADAAAAGAQGSAVSTTTR
jgi:hypothetical protein